MNINAALILDYSKDGEETKVEDATLIQIKGETAATEGNHINIRYDGLCFSEEDGNHRMEPNVGEKQLTLQTVRVNMRINSVITADPWTKTAALRKMRMKVFTEDMSLTAGKT